MGLPESGGMVSSISTDRAVLETLDTGIRADPELPKVLFDFSFLFQIGLPWKAHCIKTS